jgi:D-alanyl-D-alanine carboxypeptidase/D-alanyl-D-alanine-endopeptidase (penicillin-binding protein 4)
MKRLLALAFVLVASTGGANAGPTSTVAANAVAKAKPTAATKTKAPTTRAGRVTYGKELRTAREVIGRREEPLTLEEQTAKQIERLLRGPLRNSTTGLFVADAHTGEPLFAVNADDPLNPASNVKMISTATALELLGSTFKYTTRVLADEPDATGTIHGDMFLLGTWDPTLAVTDMDQLAEQLSARGVKALAGDVIVGSDPTRDGIYRAMVPIEIKAGEPNQPPTASAPAGFDLFTFDVQAKTDTRPYHRQTRLRVTNDVITVDGHKRIKVTVVGKIGKGGDTMVPLYAKDRTLVSAHALRAALKNHGITVTGDTHIAELGDFVGDTVKGHALPIELARHESPELQEIVRRVNKWSINWLADRVIMTAAALSSRTTPTMDGAVSAMYGWLQRHPQLKKDEVTIDTGSGLSYRTRISPEELVKVVRSAGGFADGTDQQAAKAWLDSLSIAGTDGTLRSRFKTSDVKGRMHCKTGSLSTVIALSGVLDLDPTRPLVFSIVTNTRAPLKKGYVRKAHEQLVGLIAKYVTATAKPTAMPISTPIQLGTPAVDAPPPISEPTPDEEKAADAAEAQPDPELDVEAATSK